MKAIFAILFFSASFFTTQAQDSTGYDLDFKLPIALKQVHFGHIWRHMSTADKASADGFQLLSQLVSKISDTANLEHIDTVTVRRSFLIRQFKRLGELPEGKTNNINTEMKAMLLPQIMQYPAVIGEISAVLKINAEDTRRSAVYGVQEILLSKE